MDLEPAFVERQHNADLQRNNPPVISVSVLRKRLARDELMKFNQARYKVPHLGQDNPKHGHRLGDERIESCPEENDSEV